MAPKEVPTKLGKKQSTQVIQFPINKPYSNISSQGMTIGYD
jgi:hypothetical protein